MGMSYWTEIESPVGPLLIEGDGDTVSSIQMHGQRYSRPRRPALVRDDGRLALVARELSEYFAGERTEFGFGVAFTHGSEFQQRVWRALLEIPYGETWSYGRLAEHIGIPGEARAVGSANARNPVAIAVPCHRVIGSDGSLTGYAGGLERKRYLLDLEAGLLRLDSGFQAAS
jgi:methylated-DNA-[protein]-cysteine S-methyltransferase